MIRNLICFNVEKKTQAKKASSHSDYQLQFYVHKTLTSIAMYFSSTIYKTELMVSLTESNPNFIIFHHILEQQK